MGMFYEKRGIYMNIGYLLGGLANLIVACWVIYWGGIKKSPGLLRYVKAKLSNGDMSDQTAVNICLISPILLLLVGIFLLVFGAIKG
jgi:hypothetical protein